MKEPGSTVKYALLDERERVKKAIYLQKAIGENKKGIIYEKCSREEAEDVIMDIFEHNWLFLIRPCGQKRNLIPNSLIRS